MQAREPVELLEPVEPVEPVETGYIIPPELIAFIIGFTATPIYICILHAFPLYFRGKTRQVRGPNTITSISPGHLEKLYQEKLLANQTAKVWGSVDKNYISLFT